MSALGTRQLRKIQDALVMIVMTPDRPTPPAQLVFWLQHMPAERSWLDAPRPDWLLYLVELEGKVAPRMLDEARDAVAVAMATERRDEGDAPLSEGAEHVRAILGRDAKAVWQ
jgi:hypothetical protein